MAEPTTDLFDTRIADVQRRMAELGHPIRIVSKKRTQAEQEALYRKGRGDKGGIVTEKSGRPGDESRHQLGLAADIAFLDAHGQPSFAESHPWKLLGQVGRESGLEWGGDWTTLKDRPHLQLSMRDMPVPKGTQIVRDFLSGVKVTDPASTTGGTTAPTTTPTASAAKEAPMPQQQTAYKIIDKVPHKWVPNPAGTGGTWQPVPALPAAGRGTRAGLETPEEHRLALEGIKQLFTIGGGIVGTLAMPEVAAAPFLATALGLTGAGLGGGVGRMAGHFLESRPRTLSDLVTGQNTNTYGGEFVKGAGEGIVNEMVPRAVGPAVGWLGKGLQGAGRMAFDNPRWSPWLRARIASMRGGLGAGLGWATGGGPMGAAAGSSIASLGPIAATEGGLRLERAGANMSRAGLAERAKDSLDALLSKVWPAERPLAASLTAAEHAERMGAAAEAIASERGPGTPRVNREPFTAEGPSQPWTPPPAKPAPRTSTGDPMHVDPRTDFRPEVRTNPAGSGGGELPVTPSGEAPDVTHRPRPEGAPGGQPPPSDEVTVNPESYVQSRSDRDLLLSDDRMDFMQSPDYRPGMTRDEFVQALQRRSMPTPEPAPNVARQMDALRERALDPAVEKLTPDQLVEHYAGGGTLPTGAPAAAPGIELNLTGPNVLPPGVEPPQWGSSVAAKSNEELAAGFERMKQANAAKAKRAAEAAAREPLPPVGRTLPDGTPLQLDDAAARAAAENFDPAAVYSERNPGRDAYADLALPRPGAAFPAATRADVQQMLDDTAAPYLERAGATPPKNSATALRDVALPANANVSFADDLSQGGQVNEPLPTTSTVSPAGVAIPDAIKKLTEMLGTFRK